MHGPACGGHERGRLDGAVKSGEQLPLGIDDAGSWNIGHTQAARERRIDVDIDADRFEAGREQGGGFRCHQRRLLKARARFAPGGGEHDQHGTATDQRRGQRLGGVAMPGHRAAGVLERRRRFGRRGRRQGSRGLLPLGGGPCCLRGDQETTQQMPTKNSCNPKGRFFHPSKHVFHPRKPCRSPAARLQRSPEVVSVETVTGIASKLPKDPAPGGLVSPPRPVFLLCRAGPPANRRERAFQARRKQDA